MNYHDDDDDDDGLWEKPVWAKGGIKLKSTGKADQMKKEGNLAMPITNIRDEIKKQKVASRYSRYS
jgi:hypothetical protein